MQIAALIPAIQAFCLKKRERRKLKWYPPIKGAASPSKRVARWAHLRWHPKFNSILIGDKVCLRKKGSKRALRSLPDEKDGKMKCEKCGFGYLSTRYWWQLRMALCPSCALEEMSRQKGGMTSKEYYATMLKLIKENRKEFVKTLKIVKDWDSRLPKCPDCGGRTIVVCEKVHKNAMRVAYGKKK